MAENADLLIAGAGITGLAAAYHARRRFPGLRIVLLEQSDRLGGKICTVRANGCLLEAGPDSFLATKPAGTHLCGELGIDGQLIGTNIKRRGAEVVRAGRLHRLPEGLSGLIPARLDPILTSDLLSSAGKDRLALEPTIPPDTEGGDRSVGAFMRRRFGDETYEWLIEPLLAGIYAGDGDELSLDATFPQLGALEREHGSLMRGVGATSTPSVRPVSPFLTPAPGMRVMPDALARSLHGVTVLRNTGMLSLTRSRGGYRAKLSTGASVFTPRVLLCTPASVSAEILEPLAASVSQSLSEIEYVSTASVYLAYPTRTIGRAPSGTGYLVPRAERSPVLACTWASEKFASRAPNGTALFRVFIGRRGHDSVPRAWIANPPAVEAELVNVATAEIHNRLEIRGRPNLVRAFVWPNAMPQYNIGHLRRLAEIDESLSALPAIRLAGSSYRGVGIPDCIQAGRQAVEELLTAH